MLANYQKINGVDDNGKEPAKERDFDFLSSIEVSSALNPMRLHIFPLSFIIYGHTCKGSMVIYFY
jgi:hypothetical protein